MPKPQKLGVGMIRVQTRQVIIKECTSNPIPTSSVSSAMRLPGTSTCGKRCQDEVACVVPLGSL